MFAEVLIGVLIDFSLAFIDLFSLYLLFKAKRLAPMYRIIQLALITDFLEISSRLIHDYIDRITEQENFAITIPLFFACCGFKFYLTGYYWNLDNSKPGYQFYTLLGIILQLIAVAFLVLSDVVLLIKLKSFTIKKNTIQQLTTWLRSLSGESRLGLCLAFYTLGFLFGNINFNILSKFQGPLIQVLNSIFNIAYYLKFMPYAITARL
ncbi:unnamed protein product, partial [Mesorhabditis belari]|uniref:Uncharacterized protein n=1 Tax=Mesorhabditis belari TaxID=2138241 RepID=A0AAF3FR48_9BILA